MTRFWALACLFLLAAHPAFAETRSVGYAIWNGSGGDVRVLYMLPDSEAKKLAAANSPEPTTKQVAAYVLAHFSVIRQGKACPVADQGQDVGLINTLALTPGLMRFEVVFACENGEGLTLSDTAFSDRVSNHTDFARVQIGNGGFVQHLFTPSAPRMNLPGADGTLRSDSIARYVPLGLWHVFRSIDILCFMLALLLIVRRRRDFELALGALTTGYAVALLLSTFALAAPRFGTGQAFSGLLVLLTAATGVALSLPEPRRSAWVLAAGAVALGVPVLFFRSDAAAFAVLGVALLAVGVLFVPGRETQRALFLAAVPFLFALLDGFTLAGDLAVLALPPVSLAPMLVGFNVTVLLGEAALALGLVAVWHLVPTIRRMTAPGGFLPDLTAAGLIGCGVFWFGTGL